MTSNLRYIVFCISILYLFTIFDIDACAKNIKIDSSIPLYSQVIVDNTTYEIDNDCDISQTYVNKTITCDRSVNIVRTQKDFKCNESVNIDSKIYYITSEPIKIYWNESLIIPNGCIIVDAPKKQILSKEKLYRNQNENTIYIGSKKKTEGKYQHCKVYYACRETIDLMEDEGMITTDDCVVLDSSMQNIETYQPCYIPGKHCKFYIAKREKGDIPYQVLKVLSLPSNITLNIKHGLIKNGILKCNKLHISDSGKRIFSNVILTGSIVNESIKVEWFGCSIINDGKDNYDIVSKYVFPSAIFTRSNIFHSQKGTYDFEGGYPIKNYHWGYDHNYILDCNGIEIYGTGSQSIIQGEPTGGDNPADVFSFVDLKNIKIRDLAVTAKEGNGNKTHGTNAFSLCQNVENITIERTKAFDLPVLHKPTYPDGAKGYTIQADAGCSQSNVLIKDNEAKNVAYGFDYTRVSRADWDYRKNIRFVGNRIQDAIVGCVIHEEVSPNRNEKEYILVDGNEFKNCQVGMYCMLVKALTITNNRFVKNKEVTLTKYYNDCYGLFITGAFNTRVENNHFSLNDCKSFIYVTQYSFDPVWHGEISSLRIDDAILKGKSRGVAVDIGPDAKTENQKKFFKNVSVSNIKK